MTSLSAVSANLGCGGPHTSARAVWARRWLEQRTRNAIDILFLQEVPADAAATLATDYQVFTPAVEDGDFRCRSMVAIRSSSNLLASQFALPTARYHGSYLATAMVNLPDLGPIVLASVHASPTRPTIDQRSLWPDDLVEPSPRPTGNGELWDSDYVLATLAHHALAGRHVLAAGDFNEARAWDGDHPGAWGAEYFEAAQLAGLVDVTFRHWGKTERATHGPYQDDHIFATAAVDDLITRTDVERDAGESDHHPVAFVLTTIVS